MERLTKLNSSHKWRLLKSLHKKILESSFAEQVSEDEILCLAELEDKFESGQLVDLMCSVGEIIFVPYVYEKQSGIMSLIVEAIRIEDHTITIITDFETDDREFALSFDNGKFGLRTHNHYWFTDKEKAEARLKELQELK